MMFNRIRSFIAVSPMVFGIAASAYLLFLNLRDNKAMAALAFVLGTVVTGMLIERMYHLDPMLRALRTLPDCIQHRKCPPEFHDTRKGSRPLVELLDATEKEIFFVGNRGGLVAEQWEPFHDRLVENQHLRVRFLLMDPEIIGKNPDLTKAMQQISNDKNIVKQLEITLDKLREHRDQLAKSNGDAAERFEVRLYKTVVPLVIMFLDADKTKGQVQIELLPYQFSPGSRPNILLQTDQYPQLCNDLYDNYEALWNDSTPLFA